MKYTVLYETGTIPYKVALGTRSDRKDTLYLRWRVPGNWKWLSTNHRLTDPGALEAGKAEAQRQCARLLVGVPEAAPVSAPLVTLSVGLALAIDPKTGKYPEKTQHRNEVERELTRAVAILEDRAFAAIDEAQLCKLWRERIRQLLQEGRSARRAAEITVSRVLAVAAWLRKRKHIPITACLPPEDWLEELEKDWRAIAKQASNHEPHRPRHTRDEMRRILDVVTSQAALAFDIDPRFCLLLTLGAELRLGQVVRMWRSDLDLEDGAFLPPSTGSKRMPKVYLTPGQRAELEYALGDQGYLRTLELRWKHDGQDYRLFPGRSLKQGQALYPEATPIARSPIRRMFHAAEDLAGVRYVEGRAAYGLRRAGVDGAKAEGATRDELKEGGGWTDTTMPDRIYADQEADTARRGAALIRARVRGEK